MRGNRKTGTAPEIRIQQALTARAVAYRANAAIAIGDLTVVADIVIDEWKLALFVDGCFWHGCPIHGSVPATNATYWSAKLARNRQRDSLVSSRLAQSDWILVRCWEHESPDEVVNRIFATGRGRPGERS